MICLLCKRDTLPPLRYPSLRKNGLSVVGEAFRLPCLHLMREVSPKVTEGETNDIFAPQM